MPRDDMEYWFKEYMKSQSTMSEKIGNATDRLSNGLEKHDTKMSEQHQSMIKMYDILLKIIIILIFALLAIQGFRELAKYLIL